MIRTRPIEDKDIAFVAANIRAMDRLECEQIWQCEPEAGIRESIDRSPWSCAVISRDELICLVGVAADGDLLTRRGMPWLIGVEGIEAHPRAFAILTGPIIQRMEAEYPLLSNIVLQENELSVRWLERAGFTLADPERINGADCLRFWKAREDAIICGDCDSGERRNLRLRVCERGQGGA